MLVAHHTVAHHIQRAPAQRPEGRRGVKHREGALRGAKADPRDGEAGNGRSGEEVRRRRWEEIGERRYGRVGESNRGERAYKSGN